MKKIKILVEAHVFDGEFQGTRTYLKGLYSAISLNHKEFQIFFICSNPQSIKPEFISCPINFIQYFFNNKFLRYFIEMPYLVWKHKIDYCHFQYFSPLIPYSKFIVTIHDILFVDYPNYFSLSYSKIRNLLFYLSAKTSTILLTVSKYSAQQISIHYKINLEKIIITPNAVTKPKSVLNHFIKDKYKIENFILYVSRIEPRKNQYGLLKAFVDLALFEKKLYLVLIGKTSIRDLKFDLLFNSLPNEIKKYIIYLDSVSDIDLAGFYNECDLFIYPTFAEGFGIPPIEAALYKKKVICSNQTAMSDFDFFNKGFFDPNESETLKLKISKFLHEEIYSEQELNMIVQIILKRYSWNTSAYILVEILNKT